MKIDKRTIPSSKGDITLYKITNTSGASVELSSLGAGITSLIVPDNTGKMDDVVLGYKNACDYLYDGPCAGKTPGRYANRIARGTFYIAGKKYQLAINNEPNALHGGPEGFQNRIWDSSEENGQITFSLVSEDGDENYPGTLKAKVTYSWSEENRLRIELNATTNDTTIVNLTNHTYWNLAGEGSGSVLNHHLQLNCSKYLPTDSTLIPTGELADVKETPMDFTVEKTLGKDIKAEFPALKYGKGYDNCWVIDNWKPLTLTKAGVLSDPSSGRVMEFHTTQPGAQIYTGNWLAGSPESKSEKAYNDYDGVAIECQGFPDAPNQPNFPSQLLRIGERYHHIIVYSLKTK